MAKKEKTQDAVSILHGRYVKDDPERKAALQYLKDGPLSELALAVFLVNDFLYVQ